ncbi:alanine racemase [Grimontia marina]|uniref:L-glutamyl-[BtrI acyl-carrier protein] decarboxylase n=1 Tax=Grimontia marina TaxID=646534 RepID=A0A128FFZ4_9GAMM|nr:alanine racemase [Grimontia marina]CZF85216.1 L-glutamyl-[BtrI acyl-carrier protein] decarboxylase [Grimontia marina]
MNHISMDTGVEVAVLNDFDILFPAKEDLSLPYRQLFPLITNAANTPFHAILPHRIKENINSLKQVLSHQLGAQFQVLYAMKTNRSAALVKAAAEEGIGIDVSSLEEFQLALTQGVNGRQCSLSGPFKSEAFLTLALRQEARIVVDSDEELLQIQCLASSIRKSARVLLRWNAEQPHTRFGMNKEKLKAASLFADSLSNIELEGAGFHLSGYCPLERGKALSELLDIADALRFGADIRWKAINIGGGYPLRYVEEATWRRFQNAIDKEDFAAGRMPKSFYPYWHPDTMETAVEKVLKEGGNAARLKANRIELIVEPGRALTDGAGFTTFEVLGTKTTNAGDYCVIVKGLSFSFSETWFNSEFIVDPLHLPVSEESTDSFIPVRAYIAGQSCLEEDVLTYRKVPFSQMPKAGDLLVFNNTAGYLMDLLETRFHGLPIPNKVVLDNKEDSFLIEEVRG